MRLLLSIGLVGRWVILGLGVVTALVGCTESKSDIATVTLGLGEPTDGFPDWSERALHVWTNRARSDPAADLAGCSVCAESACYSPVPPMVWNHNLGRAARFHSDNLVRAGCGLQHASPCTLVSSINVDYTPGPCDGSESCACVGGSANCGSSGTSWSARVAAFGTSPNSENIASGRTDPVSTFYLWLWEPDSNPACGWRASNGHRANILRESRQALGVGKSSSTYTQDFAGSGTPDGIVSAVHYPETGSDIDFRANWFSSAGPITAMVDVDGTCYAMTLERGSDTNGTFLANVTGVASTCVRYFFRFTDGSGDVFYPTVGSYGINCANFWESSRPALCGPCTPDCTGRMCGSDGCGGFCGTCTGGLTCDVAGNCVCGGTMCGADCVDTNTDPNNCGTCGIPCAQNEICAGGICQCAPDCAGRECGDNGCGGSCGPCNVDETCDPSGTCVCDVGLTDCSGTCIDTDTDRRNCGMCGRQCSGNEFCVNGNCIQNCTPDCTVRVCGDDGCGGSCGNCTGGKNCNASGACVCPGGMQDCSGVCIDTDNDLNNCGMCGMPCSPVEICSLGTCVCVRDCSGRDCGGDGCGQSCGTCSGMRTCSGGICVCGGNLTDCNGQCVDTRTDPANCGMCGIPCAMGETCQGSNCVPTSADAGACVPDCTGRQCSDDACGGSCGTCTPDRTCGAGGVCLCLSGTMDCSGTCVDTRTDLMHCGTCDQPCGVGQRCINGGCFGSPDAGASDAASIPDASGSDAGVPETDGGTTAHDGAVAKDGSIADAASSSPADGGNTMTAKDDVEGGCGCSAERSGRSSSFAFLLLIILSALVRRRESARVDANLVHSSAKK